MEKPSAGSDRLERQSAFPNSLELEHEHDYDSMGVSLATRAGVALCRRCGSKYVDLQ